MAVGAQGFSVSVWLVVILKPTIFRSSTPPASEFAPTIAVPQDDRWGRTYEGFSEDPTLVSKLGKALILGLQGEGATLLDENHVLATAKHFMGDGGTTNGVDQGNTKISELGLRELHGYPYFDALDACAQTVMASFNSWNGIKMHGNEYILNDILRSKLFSKESSQLPF